MEQRFSLLARRSKSRGGMLAGIFVGLVVGVLIAFGVVWYLNKSPLPFQDKSPRPAPAAGPDAAAAKPAEPQTLPGKPGDKPIEKPRFDFYKILPGNQDAAPAPTTPEPAPVATEQFYLQLGAFQKPADADNLKAKLALMGFEASVQEVSTADKGVLQRVRVGPYSRPEDMNRVRNQLAQAGIQATVVKIKDAGTSAPTPESKPGKP